MDYAQNSLPLKIAINVVVKESQEGPFILVSVGDLLFNGYVDPLIGRICDHGPLVKTVCKLLKIPDRIGLFYGVRSKAKVNNC